MERVAIGIMESVDDGFQLSTYLIKINWRGYDEHICLVHLFIDDGHVILLSTDAIGLKTCVASQGMFIPNQITVIPIILISYSSMYSLGLKLSSIHHT